MTQEEIQAFMEKLQQSKDESREEEKGEGAVKPVRFPPIKPEGIREIKSSLVHFEDITVKIYAELGQTSIKIKDLLNLEAGSVLELNKAAGESVDVYINDRHFARGEILVTNDYFAVRLNKILRPGHKLSERVQEGK